MRLNHVALWADDIESVRLFYMKYFGALCNDRYVNESKKFTSYFYLLMREQLVLN